MWRLPRDAARSFEYVDFPWKCPPSEWEIHKAVTAQYRSTYRCDFMSMRQAYFLSCCGTCLTGDDHDNNPERKLISNHRRKVPPSTDTEMRDNYRQPKQRPEMLHCSRNPKVACRGIVPTVVQRHIQGRQNGSDLTNYDRFCGKRVTNVKRVMKSLLPQELQQLHGVLPEEVSVVTLGFLVTMGPPALLRCNVRVSVSILYELGRTEERMRNSSGPGSRGEKVTDDFSAAPRRVGVSEDRKQQPEWLIRELLKQNRRRHSVTLGDRAHTMRRQHHSTDLTHSLCSLQEFETDGLRSTDAKNFGRIVKKCLGLSNTEYQEKQGAKRRSKQVAFTLPATVKTLSNNNIPITNIRCTHDGTIVTVREDGFVCRWSPELNPLKTKHIFNEEPANRKSKWASDFTLMTEYNKLMIATGDREIQLYELSTLAPYCQINALDTVPLTLNYRLWNELPKIENIPNITIDNAVLSPNVTFVRWKVHQDWVTQIWDIQDECCLFTADTKASRIHGDTSACSYSSATKSLYVAADCMAVLSLKIRTDHRGERWLPEDLELQQWSVPEDTKERTPTYGSLSRLQLSCRPGPWVSVMNALITVHDCTLQALHESRFQQKITKLAKTDEGTLLYAADRIGYIYVYNMEQFAPEQKSPRGTFGQSESWSVHISSSWKHPAVPYEVLIDPLSLPDHAILNLKSEKSDKTEGQRTELKLPLPCSDRSAHLTPVLHSKLPVPENLPVACVRKPMHCELSPPPNTARRTLAGCCRTTRGTSDTKWQAVGFCSPSEDRTGAAVRSVMKPNSKQFVLYVWFVREKGLVRGERRFNGAQLADICASVSEEFPGRQRCYKYQRCDAYVISGFIVFATALSESTWVTFHLRHLWLLLKVCSRLSTLGDYNHIWGGERAVYNL
ncbi:Testis-expressed protein 26 [Collichthys lucidus]|uniref:Testis-expressed protein 26 n=1 Tax=Collichthys lucidus TaxID=240159 RepID=A0A4U5UZE8_COLLU|nr:Testis-expressed protein 26 [Collichthys lucidus]